MPIGDLEQFFFNLISFNLDSIEYDITNILRRVYRFCYMGMTSQPMEIITDCVTFSRGMRSQNLWQNSLLFNQFEETRKSTDHVFCACARRTRISLKVVSRPFLMFRLNGTEEYWTISDGTIMIGILEDDFLYILSFVGKCFTVGQ